MSKENSFNQPKNKWVEGDGFITRKSPPRDNIFRGNLEDAPSISDTLASLLDTEKSYSRTYRVLPNGMFDPESVGSDKLKLGHENTPEGLYQVAEEIQKKHPEYEFHFERDPEGQWMKYTVSKAERRG